MLPFVTTTSNTLLTYWDWSRFSSRKLLDMKKMARRSSGQPRRRTIPKGHSFYWLLEWLTAMVQSVWSSSGKNLHKYAIWS
jgi:hypothetical protein